MTTSARATHWLVGVAQRASLPGAAALTTAITTPVTVAWKDVGQTCGQDDAAIAACVAGYFRLPVADLRTAQPGARRLLPEALARRRGVFPLRVDDKHIVVATSDPTNLDVEQDVSFASGRHVTLEIAPPTSIAEIIDASYAPQKSIERMVARPMPRKLQIERQPHYWASLRIALIDLAST